MQLELTEGYTYKGIVLSILPNASRFLKSGTSTTVYCHFMEIEVPSFGKLKTQCCTESPTIDNFSIGDRIQFIAKAYTKAKDQQTIRVEGVVETAEQIKMSETVGTMLNTGIKSAVDNGNPPAPFRDPGIPPVNPMVHGSIWATCLFNAVTFHKDKKTSKDEDVLESLQKYYDHYQQFITSNSL